MRAAVAEGTLRGDIDIDAAIDLLYGTLYYRLLLGSGTLDEFFIENICRQFLGGHAVISSKRPPNWRP